MKTHGQFGDVFVAQEGWEKLMFKAESLLKRGKVKFHAAVQDDRGGF